MLILPHGAVEGVQMRRGLWIAGAGLLVGLQVAIVVKINQIDRKLAEVPQEVHRLLNAK